MMMEETGGRVKKITFKKLISIALTVALMTTSIPPRAAEASWFSDFFGGLFTIITAPIWVFCTDNPTFRKNNPFRKKAWEFDDNRIFPHDARNPLNKNGFNDPNVPEDDYKLMIRQIHSLL
jgi:hypothetical protein